MGEVIFEEGAKAQPPCSYNWKILVASGDVKDIKFSLSHQFLDFSKSRKDNSFLDWEKRLQEIQKPYILAVGNIREEVLDKVKSYKIAKYLDKNGRLPKGFKSKKAKLPIHEVYGLFSEQCL